MIRKADAAIRVVTRPIYGFYQKSPHIEHVGFVLLATTEVFHFGPAVFFVNVILMVSGALAVAYEHLSFYRKVGEGPVCPIPKRKKGKTNARSTDRGPDDQQTGRRIIQPQPR